MQPLACAAFTYRVAGMVYVNSALSKPGKGIRRLLEFVSLPPPRPSPTGEGVVWWAAAERSPQRGWFELQTAPGVGAADNSPAGLEFCRVAMQVMGWKEV